MVGGAAGWYLVCIEHRSANPAHSFVQNAAEFAAVRGLFGKEGGHGGHVLVALSGGPDSCALLLALCEAADAGLPLPRPVGAAHFHHGLRGNDADEDAAFAAALAARCGLPCRVGLGSVPRGRGSGSPNAAARRARYAFLEESARALGADCIATAHTADDQAETVLLRVLRGTSVDGIAGIPPRRELSGGLIVVRPLLGARRADVEAYCRDRGIVPRRDPSNAKDRYARARLRKRIPEIADAFNPRLVDALCRLAENAAADSDLLGRMTDALGEETIRVTPSGAVLVDAALLLGEPPALRRRVLLRALRAATEPLGTAEEAATSGWVEALEELMTAGHGRLTLPGGLRAEIEQEAAGRLLLTAPVTGGHFVPDDYPAYPLPVPGSVFVSWAGVAVSARLLAPNEAPAPRVRRAAVVDVAMPAPPVHLTVRTVRAGERMAPLGMGGHTRLIRDLLADAGIPAAERSRFPAVVRAESGEILWLIGISQAESTRVERGTTSVVRLEAIADAQEPGRVPSKRRA